ncbi:MAG: hypothetical protein Q9212_006363 [Teloschistes hypoglaucus]
MDDKSAHLPGKEHSPSDDEKAPPQYVAPSDHEMTGDVRGLSRALKGRHMQMIAIGLLGFIIIGAMMLFTIQALGELAVLYPVNGAFYMYAVRFIDPAWGFAMGWEYAINWLVILPFEITAAGITISYWREDINIGVWIAVFLFALVVVQVFAVRGYGEGVLSFVQPSDCKKGQGLIRLLTPVLVEFVLGIIKVVAVTGFIILGIIIDCGGVPTDPRGYIGARYWHDPGAFRNGFKGFCTVFVTAGT